MLRSLSVAVLRYERVRTTEAKAKEVRRLVDRVVGLGRDGSLHARRRALAFTRDPLIVDKVFTDLRERFADRPSGFTRLSRLGHRVGDGAPLMLVELLEGAPAQPKPADAAPEAATEGGVRGIARRLRGGGRGEERPAPRSAAEREKAAPPKAEKRAAKPKAEQKPKAAGGKRASGQRPPLTEQKSERKHKNVSKKEKE